VSTQVYSGRYEIVEHLARGGMAEVYVAHDQLLDRRVALKVLFPEFAADHSFVERFRREARSAAALNHPNIVSVYDTGEENGAYYIVMEYVEGRTLRDIIRSEGPLLPQRAADIGADIAGALAFAHRHGVVHRVVKPGNVLLDRAGRVKVTDFGIARAGNTQENLTQTGAVMGTATYFSPEQAQGGAIDPRSDVYSLGVVLYEMATGRPPFSGDSPVAIAYQHVRETPAPPSSVNPDVPPDLEACILKCMAKNPANRYATADDLRADLIRFGQGQRVQAEPVLAPPISDATLMTPALDATRVVSQTRVGTVLPEEAPARSGMGRYVGLLLLLLAVLGVLLWLLASQLGLFDKAATRVAVPKVLDLTEDQARTRLEAKGFKVKAQQGANDTVAAGKVYDQAPGADVKADKGSQVTIFVSSGAAPLNVPDVVGQDEAAAVAALGRAGFTNVTVTRRADNDAPAGRVLEQTPKGNDKAAKDAPVTIIVSSGRDRAVVPDVRGRDLADAANLLGQRGFQTTTKNQASDTVGDGKVITTDPAAGQQADRNSLVTIFVSTGPDTATVPNVEGETQGQATADLQGAGFVVATKSAPAQKDKDIGNVISQDPAPNTKATKGSTVTITVGSQP
jgi:beta-lactam-binding protein with PASTA domain/tRNA A-37 threonylcarbamoyl transferase component Bud32